MSAQQAHTCCLRSKPTGPTSHQVHAPSEIGAQKPGADGAGLVPVDKCAFVTPAPTDAKQTSPVCPCSLRHSSSSRADEQSLCVCLPAHLLSLHPAGRAADCPVPQHMQSTVNFRQGLSNMHTLVHQPKQLDSKWACTEGCRQKAKCMRHCSSAWQHVLPCSHTNVSCSTLAAPALCACASKHRAHYWGFGNPATVEQCQHALTHTAAASAAAAAAA